MGAAVVAVQPQAAVVRQQVAQQRQPVVDELEIGAFRPGIGVLHLAPARRIAPSRRGWRRRTLRVHVTPLS
jgi:hypothetical protein